jgi:NAD(P)-dependent dehydrogenase (short-subunit alcohol dehydrogenase family)
MFGYVLKSIKKDSSLQPSLKNLKGKTYIVSGGTRGIGLSIGKKLSSLGANVAIFGKTQKHHPKLEGTILTAAKEIQDMNPDKDSTLGLYCDIRNPESIENSVNMVVNKFNGIDGVILNASALCLNNTLKQETKEINLMTEVNIRGSFLVGKNCIKHLKKSEHPHILSIAPPLNMINDSDWWINHLYYSMSKYNMSLMTKMWHHEFPNVGANTLWPRTTINTAPVRNILGGEEMINISRDVSIVSDAAAHILMADPLKCTGKNFIDDEVIVSMDGDVEKYRVNKNIKEKDLMPDFFC